MEKEAQSEEKNWLEFDHTMEEYALSGELNQLEDLLREEHPFLPGEKEAFELLQKGLGREPRVKLDKTGFHVIPIEQEEE